MTARLVRLCTAKTRYFRLITTNMNWQDARKYCTRLHRTAHLVVIRNADEQKEVNAYVQRQLSK